MTTQLEAALARVAGQIEDALDANTSEKHGFMLLVFGPPEQKDSGLMLTNIDAHCVPDLLQSTLDTLGTPETIKMPHLN